ncbi:unnamed protein product [Sympodiomycopsis kandeliae]
MTINAGTGSLKLKQHQKYTHSTCTSTSLARRSRQSSSTMTSAIEAGSNTGSRNDNNNDADADVNVSHAHREDQMLGQPSDGLQSNALNANDPSTSPSLPSNDPSTSPSMSSSNSHSSMSISSSCSTTLTSFSGSVDQQTAHTLIHLQEQKQRFSSVDHTTATTSPLSDPSRASCQPPRSSTPPPPQPQQQSHSQSPSRKSFRSSKSRQRKSSESVSTATSAPSPIKKRLDAIIHKRAETEWYERLLAKGREGPVILYSPNFGDTPEEIQAYCAHQFAMVHHLALPINRGIEENTDQTPPADSSTPLSGLQMPTAGSPAPFSSVPSGQLSQPEQGLLPHSTQDVHFDDESHSPVQCTKKPAASSQRRAGKNLGRQKRMKAKKKEEGQAQMSAQQSEQEEEAQAASNVRGQNDPVYRRPDGESIKSTVQQRRQPGSHKILPCYHFDTERTQRNHGTRFDSLAEYRSEHDDAYDCHRQRNPPHQSRESSGRSNRSPVRMSLTIPPTPISTVEKSISAPGTSASHRQILSRNGATSKTATVPCSRPAAGKLWPPKGNPHAPQHHVQGSSQMHVQFTTEKGWLKSKDVSSPSGEKHKLDQVTCTESLADVTPSVSPERSSRTGSRHQRHRQRNKVVKAAKEKAMAFWQTEQIAEVVSAAERGEYPFVTYVRKGSSHSRSSSAQVATPYTPKASQNGSRGHCEPLHHQTDIATQANISVDSLDVALSKAGTEDSFKSAKSGHLSSAAEYATATPAETPSGSRSISREEGTASSDVCARSGSSDQDNTLPTRGRARVERQQHNEHETDAPASRSDPLGDNSQEDVLQLKSGRQSSNGEPEPIMITSSASGRQQLPWPSHIPPRGISPPIVLQEGHGDLPLASTPERISNDAKRSVIDSTASTSRSEEEVNSNESRAEDSTLGVVLEDAKWREALSRTETWCKETEHAKLQHGKGHLTPSEASVRWSSADTSSTKSSLDEVKLGATWDDPYGPELTPVLAQDVEEKLSRRFHNTASQILGGQRWSRPLFKTANGRNNTPRKPLRLSDPQQFATFVNEVNLLPSFEEEHQRRSRAREERLSALAHFDLEGFVQTRVPLSVDKVTGHVKYMRGWRTHSTLFPGRSWTLLAITRPSGNEECAELQQGAKRSVLKKSKAQQDYQCVAANPTSAKVLFGSNEPKSNSGSLAPTPCTAAMAMTFQPSAYDPGLSSELTTSDYSVPTDGPPHWTRDASMSWDIFTGRSESTFAQSGAHYQFGLNHVREDTYYHLEAPDRDIVPLKSGPDIQWMETLKSLSMPDREAIVDGFAQLTAFWESSSLFWDTNSSAGTAEQTPLIDHTALHGTETDGVDQGPTNSRPTIGDTQTNPLNSPVSTTAFPTTLPAEVISPPQPMQYFRYRRHANMEPSSSVSENKCDQAAFQGLLDAVQIQLKRAGSGPTGVHGGSKGTTDDGWSVSAPLSNVTASDRPHHRVSHTIEVTPQATSPGRKEKEAEALRLVQQEYELRQRQAQAQAQSQATLPMVPSSLLWRSPGNVSPRVRAQQSRGKDEGSAASSRSGQRDSVATSQSQPRSGQAGVRRPAATSLAVGDADHRATFDAQPLSATVSGADYQPYSWAVDMNGRQYPVALCAPYGVIPTTTDAQNYNHEVIAQELSRLYGLQAQLAQAASHAGMNSSRQGSGSRSSAPWKQDRNPLNLHVRIESQPRLEFFPHSDASPQRADGDDGSLQQRRGDYPRAQRSRVASPAACRTDVPAGLEPDVSTFLASSQARTEGWSGHSRLIAGQGVDHGPGGSAAVLCGSASARIRTERRDMGGLGQHSRLHAVDQEERLACSPLYRGDDVRCDRIRKLGGATGIHFGSADSPFHRRGRGGGHWGDGATAASTPLRQNNNKRPSAPRPLQAGEEWQR